MGFENRDYMRDEDQPWKNWNSEPQPSRGLDTQSWTIRIIIICAVIYLIDMFSSSKLNKPIELTPTNGKTVAESTESAVAKSTNSSVADSNESPAAIGLTNKPGFKRISSTLALESDLVSKPWNFWQLVTYGFAHAPFGSPSGISHILFNMFLLFMFGREIEAKLGKREFLTFYLLAIVVAGLVWVLMRLFLGQSNSACVGASGAVSAVVILFVLNYPKRKLMIWGILETPAWVIGVVFVGLDLLFAVFSRDNVAHDAHLAGAAFAAAYFKLGWNFEKFLPANLSSTFKRSPELRVHSPDGEDSADAAYAEQDAEADRILDKISAEGEESLTKKERKILESYSRRMRRKHL